MRRIPKLSSPAILIAAATSFPLAARAQQAPPPAAAPNPCVVAPPPAPRGPAPAARLVGDAKAYTPFAGFWFGTRCMRLELPLSVAGRIEGASAFPVDRYGTTFRSGASAIPEVRLGGRFSSGTAWAPFALLVEAEADIPTGIVAPDPAIDGTAYPGSQGLSVQLRKAHARASIATVVHLDVGMQVSHFGMGLLANDGAHGWEPGSAAFVEPRSGDRVLRGQLATGPHTRANLVVSFGVDKVIGDDILLPGDSAWQVFGAALIGAGKPSSAGAYVVRRHQENAAGRSTEVTVVDLTGKATVSIPGAVLGFETEWALIVGDTDLGATVEHPTHRVLQLGGAARASIDAGMFGAVFDLLYASGDQNPYDGSQNAFRVDPNYAFGLLLFPWVMSAQSARTPATAADPMLVGTPVADLERVPTHGSPTNTVALFPKMRVRPFAGFEVYGGPLFAFANVANIDLFNTRITGRQRSSLGGEAGSYLGTEIDLGVRYRALLRGSELTLGVEVGTLAPGNAFQTLDNSRMAAVHGGRGMVRYRF